MDVRKVKPAVTDAIQCESRARVASEAKPHRKSCGTTFITMVPAHPLQGSERCFAFSVVESAAGWERPCRRIEESWNRESIGNILFNVPLRGRSPSTIT